MSCLSGHGFQRGQQRLALSQAQRWSSGLGRNRRQPWRGGLPDSIDQAKQRAIARFPGGRCRAPCQRSGAAHRPATDRGLGAAERLHHRQARCAWDGVLLNQPNWSCCTCWPSKVARLLVPDPAVHLGMAVSCFPKGKP